jgi:alkylation response protein AidB-like acyl-CoA dehydrogenase
MGEGELKGTGAAERLDRPVARGSLDYLAPVNDIIEALDVAGLDELLAAPSFSHVDRSTVEAAIIEFGRFAQEVIAPTNQVGDVERSTLDPTDGSVRTPTGFFDAFQAYVAGGWGAVSFPEEFGGAGFPTVVGYALQEILASANLALSLNPVLTQSAIELLLAWGSEEQKSQYLPKLLTGEWCGTMNLTESDAGSDLGEIRAEAQRDAEGGWRVSGTKIFITWGEHELAENIVHLVLARTPGSGAGSRGLSLFLVPKVLVRGDGSLGGRNSLRALRLEEKMGIHGSPTCQMQFDAALGEMIGAEGQGMKAMFTMMNAARLSIGLQGPSLAERSFQVASRYAGERLQGRAIGVTAPTRSAIQDHPDVRRMLLSMRSNTVASRLLLYFATSQRDFARSAASAHQRDQAQAFVDLLTPIAKAWCSDLGFESTSLGIQVMGGVAYVEETGMAQHLRDSRVAQIYEGTNGIQAIDLVMRKLPVESGRWVRALLEEISSTVRVARHRPHGLEQSYVVLGEVLAVLQSITEQLLELTVLAPNDALAGATTYLELFGLVLGGWQMIRRAERALDADAAHASSTVAESEFFALERLARGTALGRPIMIGADRLTLGWSS